MKFKIFIFLVIFQVLAVSAQQRWSQCGGRNWNGNRNCNNGLECQQINEWYSQCNFKCKYIPVYGQCGGNGFRNPCSKGCRPGTNCIFMNEYYSQCL